MLVGGDQVDRMAFNRSVKESGSPHDYTVASSVAEAKTILNSTRFDVVIADYLLGDGTVFDIFEMGVDAPIIVATGVEVNMKEFLEGLARQSFRSYPIKDTRITPVIHITDYPLPASTAIHVELIINKLLSNVFKYAFAGRTEGKVKVGFGVTGDEEASLTVSDDGAGLARRIWYRYNRIAWSASCKDSCKRPVAGRPRGHLHGRDDVFDNVWDRE